MKNLFYIIIAAVVLGLMSSISLNNEVDTLEEQLKLLDAYDEEIQGPVDFDDPDFIGNSQQTLQLNFDYSEEHPN